MKKQSGFTVIELLVVVIVFVLAGMFFLQQKSQIERVDRDRQRKTSINAFHYSLQEVYYKQKGSYPKAIDEKVLPSVDPTLFKDPNGKTVGDQGSNYRYEGLDCEGDVCKDYSLRADLEAEDDFVRRSTQ
ncbi:MAG: prepilin-type N-terminal cleavage/methylation domain-containing protein [Candidatus Saccharimonadales bacterium]